MSILLVVQAGHDGTDRRDSQLRSFANATILDHALTRLSDFSDGPTIVSLSDLPMDEEVEELVRKHEASVVKGPSDDPLARFVEVIADYPAEHLVRVKVDSPLVDRHLVNEIVRHHLEAGADYTSNTLLRTFPRGLEVEAIRSDALLDAAEQATTEDERQGVTTFVTRRPANYVLNAVLAPGDYEDHDWRSTDAASVQRLTDLVNSSGGDLTKPWSDYLPFDKPSSPPATIRLRVARDNVAAALPTLADSIGHPPEHFPIGDASRRSWGVWSDDNLIGAITVSVQNGWGTLAGQFAAGLSPTFAEDTLRAVDRRLLDDDQVLALTIDGSRIRQYRS